MRYIAEGKLLKIFADGGYPEELARAVVNGITEELPRQQWQTIEEFNVEGWCWITVNGDVDMAYYDGGLFYYDDACYKIVYDTWPESTIAHVQHIPKPEVPK